MHFQFARYFKRDDEIREARMVRQETVGGNYLPYTVTAVSECMDHVCFDTTTRGVRIKSTITKKERGIIFTSLINNFV